MGKFNFKIIESDFKQIILKYESKNYKSVAKIAPEKGSNLFEYSINENDLIYYDPNLPLDHFLNGNPVIYPLPNRVNNCHYKFEGKKYWQEKNKKPIFLHSLVYDEKWNYRDPVIENNKLSFETNLKINKDHPVYEGFPFEHEIKIIYILYKNKLRIKYEINNCDLKKLPYGICFHTYFNKISNTYLKIPAKYYMELTEDKIPTGNLIKIDKTKFDFNEFKLVDQNFLDGAVTGLIDNPIIKFGENLQLEIDYSKEFSHVQLYTPPKKPFFCAEMQTCSADAHNLHERGMNKQAHLIIIKPGEKSSGWLDYKPNLC